MKITSKSCYSNSDSQILEYPRLSQGLYWKQCLTELEYLVWVWNNMDFKTTPQSSHPAPACPEPSAVQDLGCGHWDKVDLVGI